MQKIFALITFFIIALTPFQINAKTAKAKSSKTRITSDFIDIKRKSQKIEFLQNVVVKNGPDTMSANKMTVYYNDNKKPDKSQAKSNNIEKITAQGNVKIFSSQLVATGDDGYYDPKNALFILKNHVVVNNGDSIATGNKFIYDLNTRQGEFISKKTKQKPNKDNRITVIIGDQEKSKK